MPYRLVAGFTPDGGKPSLRFPRSSAPRIRLASRHTTGGDRECTSCASEVNGSLRLGSAGGRNPRSDPIVILRRADAEGSATSQPFVGRILVIADRQPRPGLGATGAFSAFCLLLFWWCPGTESNRRHEDFQSSALPTELPGHQKQAGTAARKDNTTSRSAFL